MGIDETTIYKWMTFANSISLKHLIKLADYFQCSIDYLFGRSKDYLPFTIQPLIPFSKRIREVIEKKDTQDTALLKKHVLRKGIFTNGKGSVPQLPTLIELAYLFDCSVDYLIGRERD